VPQNKPQALVDLLRFWKTNHPPGQVQHAASVVAALENAGQVTLQVTRTGGATGPASVDYSTTDQSAHAGIDYTALQGTLQWLDGDSAPKTVSIPLLAQTNIGPTRSFSLTLSNPGYASLGGSPLATVDIQEPPFQSWLFAHFGASANAAGPASPAGDFDGDGLSNLMEFVLASEPDDPRQPPPVQNTFTAGDIVLTYVRRGSLELSGIQFRIEWSTTLTGAWSTAGVTETLLAPQGAFAQYRAVIPGAGKRRLFVRLCADLQ
jgi:hypothetical protein